MWNLFETLYHEQEEEDSGYVTEKYLQGIASQVPGLNLTQWTTDRGDPQLAEQVTTTDAQAASNAGFNGTPSFLIIATPAARRRSSNTPTPKTRRSSTKASKASSKRRPR